MMKISSGLIVVAILGSGPVFSQTRPGGSHIHVVGGSINFEYRKDVSKWHGLKNSTCPFEKQNAPFYNQICVAKTKVQNFWVHVIASDQGTQDVSWASGRWEIDITTQPVNGVSNPLAICSNLNAANTGCDLTPGSSRRHVFLVPLDPSAGFLAMASPTADPDHTGMLFTFSTCSKHDGETCELLQGFKLTPPPPNSSGQFTCKNVKCQLRIDDSPNPER